MPLVRKHISRSMVGFRGKNPTMKAVGIVPGASNLECDSLLLPEFSTGVRAYRSYQRREMYYDRTEPCECFPDFIYELTNGLELIVEIKEQSELNDPATRRKYERIAETFARQNRLYRIITDREVYRWPRFENLLRLTSHRRNLPHPEERATILKELSTFCPAPLIRLNVLLGDVRIPLRLIAAGFLEFDFDEILGPDTVISVVGPDPRRLLF